MRSLENILIKELIKIKNGNMKKIDFSNHEIKELLEYLCVSSLLPILPWFFSLARPLFPTKNGGAFKYSN